MDSHEVLKEAINRLGVKAVAARMGLSESMVYKWTQPSGGDDASGARNPLDRLDEIIALTGDRAPMEGLAERCGGFFVQAPPAEPIGSITAIHSTQTIRKEFSDLLDAVTKALEGDNRISPDEARRIRREWENLKRIGERFVAWCERDGMNGSA